MGASIAANILTGIVVVGSKTTAAGIILIFSIF